MIGALFRFFLSSQIRNRKTLLVVLAGVIPIGLSILMRGLQEALGDVDLMDFSGLSFFLYLQFLVPLVAMFQGTGIIADEAEDRTLAFLLTRPVPRYLIVFSKYLACVTVGGVAIVVSLLVSYGVLGAGGSADSIDVGVLWLLHSIGVLILELCVYCLVFLLLGAVVRHPTVLGLLFVFGWEKIIAYIPGNARYASILSYLQTLYPSVDLPIESNLFRISGPISDLTAILVLGTLLLVVGGVSMNLLRLKEYAK
jgi:ABC-type transport system involved in multi-copper enzyme maturation permease subunit